MRIQFFVCAVFAAVLAAACSGTTTQTIPGAPGNAFSNAGAGQSTAKLTIRLEIPRRHRRAHYVSASTKSMSIFEGNTKLGTFDTTAGSPKCKAVNGETICSFTLGVVAGKNETFAINAFDRKSGKGNLLSAGRVVKTIVPGLNVIPITLDGVVHSIAIAIVDAN
ncbi:MAG: hypothetical protein JO192_12410, partial [Candidatus Eremiobacteraeota bacterium]|nr:hypothetical protein [Candidatus Eremiobacteraeota bacterium]